MALNPMIITIDIMTPKSHKNTLFNAIYKVTIHELNTRTNFVRHDYMQYVAIATTEYSILCKVLLQCS